MESLNNSDTARDIHTDIIRSADGDIHDTDSIHSDTSSHTEGRPSPALAVPSLQTGTAIRYESPSTGTEGSTASPTRSKKRAIGTMLEGDEEKDCIVLEKHPPPLPKRQTPPSPSKAKPTSSPPSPTSAPTYLEQPLCTEEDVDYDQACALLESYRQNDGILEPGAPILDFFDKWIKDLQPNSMFVADTLFDLILETYDSSTDEPLIARVPLVMNQILQRRRKDSLVQLFRITHLAVKITLMHLSEVVVGIDDAKVKASLDFLKTVNTFGLLVNAVPLPRAFSAFAFDKNANAEKLLTFRISLLVQYSKPSVFRRLAQIAEEYSVLNANEHSVLSMMTLVGEVAISAFRNYWSVRNITRFNERLKEAMGSDIDLNHNLTEVMGIFRDLGKFIFTHLLSLIKTEENTSILGIAQLIMTCSFLRAVACLVGPLDIEDTQNMDPQYFHLEAMKMSARLAFQGFTTETKRRDILDWSVSWFKRQMEFDYGKLHRTMMEADAVGSYVGELFRTHRLLDLLTVDRFPATTLSAGLLFFLFALKNIAALTPSELDTLHTRFVVDCEKPEYWRAWWEGLRQVITSFEAEVLRTTVLSQIQRTQWSRLYFLPDAHPSAVPSIVNNIIESTRDVQGAPIMGWDYIPVLKTLRYLLHGLVLSDVDDPHYRKYLFDTLARLFQNYPSTGVERADLAKQLFRKASTGPPNERGTDLQLLQVLLMTETSPVVINANREDIVRDLCLETPPLPVVILQDLADYKERQYSLGRENTDVSTHIRLRISFLMSMLNTDKVGQGNFHFPEDILECFWNKGLTSGLPIEHQLEDRFWGGDYITECMRDILFESMWKYDIRNHAGLDAQFFRFFIEQKLPGVSMRCLRPSSWEFVAKAIEFLDEELGLEYTSTPMPLLWKIIRESHSAGNAMKMMIARLLRHNVPTSTHKDFVESAIDEVVAIGKRSRGSIENKSTPQDYHSFVQTFETLSLFLNEYRKSEQINGQGKAASPSDSMEIEGKKTIIARCTQSPGPKNFRDIPLSPDTTLKEFYELLTSKLSLVRFRVFAQGREVSRKDTDQSKTIQEWGFKELEAVMIQVQERGKGNTPPPSVCSAETWVSARFPELQGLLSAEMRLAGITSKFLVIQPPQPKFVDRLRNLSTPWEELFSTTFPWDLYYSLYVLQACIDAYKRDDPNSQWLVPFGEKNYGKMVQLIEWLSTPSIAEVIDWTYSVASAVSVLEKYIHKDIETPWYSNLPVERVLNALLNTMQLHAHRSPYVAAPVLNILFAVSSIDTSLWLKVLNPTFCTRFYTVAVTCPNDAVREHSWNCLRAFFAKCCQGAFSPMNGTEENGSDVESRMDIDPSPSEVRDIVLYLWNVVVDCLILAKADIPHAAKAFETAAEILRVYYRALSPTDADQGIALLSRISKLARSELFSHTVQENIFTQQVDYITLGWTRLLHVALDLIPSELMDDLLPRSFASDVMKTFLFPDIKADDVYPREAMKPYCIHSETRGALFDILFKLANTQNRRSLMASYVSGLLEHDKDIFPDENYIDRSAWIQAPSRLTGIHNLSNTCYMNSLVNQLFMNIDFRNFLYGVEVHDPNGSQSLLHHLQFLFARLQLGNEKAVLPQELAGSIQDFELQPINVHIQMDVDEFFNLLFDRLEAQFSTIQERQRFRKLYGGVLRHTIKSRECLHVSSRDEDFAAIQCDVRGKKTLEESLASYVKGEMMDGDNKYSCEACGRHVDAVKQISIKDLPHNLIFHLKRFEYAVDLNRRIKVNDYFQFPRSIDLFPYTLGHIEMVEQGGAKAPEATAIVYDLVGVLVHTGTADSGHYYSYIRDPRPHVTGSEAPEQWYEFNDSEVKPWKIEDLDHWCYGGLEASYDPTYFQEAPSKSYSAYMLFYRKRPRVDALSPIMPESLLPPSEVKNQVQRCNDEFIRKYVLFGEDLCAFTANLLRSMPTTETSPLEDCELDSLENHIVELFPLVLGLQVYRLIITRLEYRSSVEKYCAALKAAIRSSPAARHYFYAWLLKTPGCLKELLLVNSNDKSRAQSAQLIATALIGEEVAKPRSHNPDNGVEALDLEMVRSIIGDLAGLVYTAGDHWRHWNEYFETLTLIANDPDWAKLLIDENMVLCSLYHYMHIHVPRRQPPRGFSRLKYPDNERVRPNYRRLITLLSRLLPLHIVPEDSVTERNYLSPDQPNILIDDEFHLLFFDCESDLPTLNRRGHLNLFVHRMFETSAEINDISTIVKWMLTETILRDGLNPHKVAIINALVRLTDPAGIFTGDALDVICKLIETPEDEDEEVDGWRNLMLFLVKRTAGWSDQLRDSVYGTEYITFWRLIYEYDSRGEGFRGIVIHHWPQMLTGLLFSNESITREKAANWAQEVIPQLLEDETVLDTMIIRSMTDAFSKLCWHTELFLERKIIISDRFATVQSVVNPVLAVLRLIAISFPSIKENPDANIEALQERAKSVQLIHDDNYYNYAEASDDMEDLETDDEESVVDGSPFP